MDLIFAATFALADNLSVFTLLLSAQFVYKIKADSVLITNDSCTAELIIENRTKDTLGFLYNKGKGRTEFRSGSGNFILNQYASKQPARAWIDTLKSTNLISDTLRTKIIDAGGFGNPWVPDLNTGIWIRPKGDFDTSPPYFGYETGRPSLSIGYTDNNFGTDSFAHASTPFYVYRRSSNYKESKMSGAATGWGKNVMYAYNTMPAGIFASGLTLDTSSTTYQFAGYGDFYNGAVLEAGFGIGASKDVAGTVKINAGLSPPHGLRVGADFNPYYTPTQQYDGFWYNTISYLRFGGGPNSYIDRFAHFYSQPFIIQTGYGHMKSGYAYYAGTLYQPGVDRPWAFYSEGANDRNYFAGQTMIGDTTVANAGANKLYVSGNSKISGSAELGDYLKLGSLTADPTGSNGMVYYNSSTNKFRGYENSTWKDLVGGGSADSVIDNNFTVRDNSDNTKKFKFEAASIPTATTITLTAPPVTSVLVSYKTTSEASNGSPAPTGDAKSNEHYITALTTGATFGAPSGTVTNGNKLIIRIKDNGVARSLSWNSVYRGGTDIILPTTTTAGKTMYLGFMYNSTDSKWDLIAYIDKL